MGHDTDAISDIVDSSMTSLVTAKYVFLARNVNGAGE
ncbi:TonB-dependent outer membrane receptor [Xanthomonas fragariae LMG 25863]|nr:TonB-dependent outer membrane receptor [Xanthomonas fragariae LMG 25863]